jgi:hypothetical protein
MARGHGQIGYPNSRRRWVATTIASSAQCSRSISFELAIRVPKAADRIRESKSRLSIP